MFIYVHENVVAVGNGRERLEAVEDLEELVRVHVAHHHVRLGAAAGAELLLERGAQVADVAVLDDRELELEYGLRGVERHKVDLHEALLLGRQRHGQVAERVELDGDVAALEAVERRLEQTVEEVDDDAVVALLVVLPRLLGELLVRLAHVAAQLHVGLLHDAVEVLVQAVEQKGEQLVRVLLLEAGELGREAAQVELERARYRVAVVARPDLVDEVGIGLGDFALAPERIHHVDLLLVALVAEVVGEQRHVAHALQRRVHKARALIGCCQIGIVFLSIEE